jgi:hypothetical protein
MSLLVAAPVTLWLVATRRPLAEQGLFFILWNIQALTQLMELGVGTLLVQFASHESPFLRWGTRGRLEGDSTARERLFVALDGARGWYGRVAIALGLAGALAGAWLIGTHTDGSSRTTLVPWLLTIGFTAAYLPLVPFLCVIEGCGGLLRVQRMRLAQAVIAVISLWTLLLLMNALWGVASFAFAWFATAWLWLRVRYAELVGADSTTHRLAGATGSQRPSRLATIQWRTGATWLAWWAAPQCVTPIILKLQGALPAGRVGMSFAIATAPLTLALAWLQARYPRYGALIATGERNQLQRLALKATMQAGAVCTLGVLAAAIVVWLIGHASPVLAGRALTPAWILILGLTNLAWLLIQSLSSYLRAWRQEPLMETAIVGAALITGGTFVAATRVPAEGVIAWYALLIAAAVVPLALVQFRRRHQHTLHTGAEE